MAYAKKNRYVHDLSFLAFEKIYTFNKYAKNHVKTIYDKVSTQFHPVNQKKTQWLVRNSDILTANTRTFFK